MGRYIAVFACLILGACTSDARTAQVLRGCQQSVLGCFAAASEPPPAPAAPAPPRPAAPDEILATAQPRYRDCAGEQQPGRPDLMAYTRCINNVRSEVFRDAGFPWMDLIDQANARQVILTEKAMARQLSPGEIQLEFANIQSDMVDKILQRSRDLAPTAQALPPPLPAPVPVYVQAPRGPSNVTCSTIGMFTNCNTW